MALSHGTEVRLGRLIDTAYYLFMLAAFYLFMRYAFWLVFPFLFSFFLAALLQRPMDFFQRKFKIKKGFTAILLVLAFYVIIGVAVVLIGVRIWASAKDFGGYLTEQVSHLPNVVKSLEGRITELTQWLPDEMEARFGAWLSSFTASLLEGQNAQGETVGMFGSLVSRIKLEWFKAPMSGVLSMAGRIPALVIAVVITVISSFFMTTGYDKIAGFFKRQLNPERRHALSAAKRIVFSSLLRLLRSYSILVLVSFCELLLGLFLLKLTKVWDGSYLFWIALATSFIDILPVLGVGTVLIPWYLYSFIMGKTGLGIGLLVLWLVMIVVRQVLEPRLVAANLGLPPIVTVMGMYIGLQLFGFIGMFLMPLLLILVKLLNDQGVVHIWKREGAAP